MNKRLLEECFFGPPFGTDAYTVRTPVRVTRGDRKGEQAVVVATWADGGDMVHRCRFDDGTTAVYQLDEITALTGNPATT